MSFIKLLMENWPELDREAAERIERFRALMVEENKVQNLTRLISEEDFVFGHALDVRALLLSRSLEYPALDLGSGAGVPGILAAIVDHQDWYVTDSERSKADFLNRAALDLGLTKAKALPLRGEVALASIKVGSVVSRAVGPVERIYGWLRNCSTWNSLVLLKGPRWKDEWGEFSKKLLGKELKLQSEYLYKVKRPQEATAPDRVIAKLARVPRGTR